MGKWVEGYKVAVCPDVSVFGEVGIMVKGSGRVFEEECGYVGEGGWGDEFPGRTVFDGNSLSAFDEGVVDRYWGSETGSLGSAYVDGGERVALAETTCLYNC